MFSDYFIQLSDQLKKDQAERARKAGQKKTRVKEKDIGQYEGFYQFLKEHLPSFFEISPGGVRSRRHLMNRMVDLLIYHKKLPRIQEMSGGFVLSEFLYSFLSVEANLTAKSLSTHIAMTNALKTLVRLDTGAPEDHMIRVYSVLFAYETEDSLDHIRTGLLKISSEKDIPVSGETDLVCVLGRGMIIKNCENGSYQIIETEEDTLMWFYILLLEYLDRDGTVGFEARQYVKQEKEYRQY